MTKEIILNNSPNISEIEENPTHFLEINNSKYDTDVKLIKVKIIVPKGTLTNSKFDHKSNVLTVMNEIDRITFNVRATSEHCSEVLKITNILNKEEQAGQKPKNNYPIMGTNALLVKTNSVKNTEVKHQEDSDEELSSLRDSAIIQELVTERYQDSMIELFQRNFKRQTSRRSSLQTTSRTISETSVDMKDTNYNFVVKHSSTMLNELEDYNDIKYFDSSEFPSLEYCSVVDTLNQLQQVQVEPEVNLQNENTTGYVQNKDHSFNSSDFNVDVTLGSAIDFILSTNGDCLDPSSTSNERERTYCMDSSNSNETPQSKSDFDEDKFLQRALGEELNGYQSCDAETSLVSSKSIGSSDVSFLLSKASSLYSTVSSKMRRLQRRLPLHSSGGTISEENGLETSLLTTTSSGNEERLARLMHDSAVQHQIIMQTGKALEYCRSVKEFTGSREVVEGERMLLLATCKRQAILEVIRKCEYDDPNEVAQNSSSTIKISNLIFNPQENTPTKTRSHKNNQWFICIVNCNEFTYATEAKMADNDGFVRFDEEMFRFDDLDMDFGLIVSLYAIVIKNGLRSYSHESKYHLKKDVKTNTSSILCPPAPTTSFLQHFSQTPKYQTLPTTPTSTKHSFLPYGTFTLRLSNINAKYYRLSKMSTVADSQLSGVFSMAVETALEVRAKGMGFMTLGQGSVGTTWSRYWCELEGCELRWWNYPPQDGGERTKPIGSINLEACISARITSVDRNICARPRTLLLETATDKTTSSSSDYETTRYLLSCDTAHDLTVWENKLNAVLGILRSWSGNKRNMF